MANIVRIFSKKLKSKNPDVDLQAVTATLMDTQEKQGEDDEYSSKVHLSDVMRELRAQVRQHRSVPTGAVPNTFPFA
jgi:endonuclease IV